MRLCIQGEEAPPRFDDVAAGNAHAYGLLFEIENGLRELIVSKMSQKFGPQWIKQKVAHDIRTSMRNGKATESGNPWITAASYHPIYYTDFTDLKKIIIQNDNWKAVFESIFGSKIQFETRISQLEPIRNRIAHARRVSVHDIETLLQFHIMLSSAFDLPISEILPSSMKSYSLAKDQVIEFKELLDSLHQAALDARGFPDMEKLTAFTEVWWFDESYLLSEIEDIRSAIYLAQEYAQLPRGRGSGHMIERWLHEKELVAKLSLAIAMLEGMISNA